MIRILTILVAVLVQPFPPARILAADEPTPSTDQVQVPNQTQVMEKVQELDDKIKELEIQRTALLEKARQLRLTATDQDRGWKELMGQIDKIKAQQESLKEQNAKVKTLAMELDSAKQELMTAEAEFAAVKKRVEEARTSLDKKSKEAETANQEKQKLEQQVGTSSNTLPDLIAAADKAELASTNLHQQISDLDKQAGTVSFTSTEYQSEIENLLRSSGNWVSFRDDIAPIFQDRCVPCHNAKNAQGRYNMANYMSIMGAGDSGLAVEPGDAELSSVYQFIVDGWMPYEADPLEAEQVELIRRWIDLGARLDSSAAADAPLIRIMPRVQQPDPPETYAAALPVTALAVTSSSDETKQRLASSGYHEVLVWSLPDRKLIQRIDNLAERIYGLDFHPSGEWLAVGSGTPGRIGEVKIFNMQSGELHVDLLATEDAVFDVAFSPSGDRLAAAAADGSVVVFELSEEAFKLQTTLRIEDHADWVTTVAWSPDGQRLVTSSRDKTSKIFDSVSGDLLQTFSDHQAAVNAAIFSADGKQVISGGDDRKLRIWSSQNGKQLHDVGGFAEPVVELLQLNNDEVLAADSSGRLRSISITDGKTRHDVTLDDGWLSSLTKSRSTPWVYIGNQSGLIQTIESGQWTPGESWLALPIAAED